MLLLIGCSNAQSLKDKKNFESKSDKTDSIYSRLDSIEKKSERGVIIVHADSLHISGESVLIYNLNNTVFSQIKSINGDEPSSNVLKNNILAYFPDYYIIHFKAERRSQNSYVIQIGNDMKQISKSPYNEFLTWEQYILRFFCITDASNPLRETPSIDSKIVKEINYKELSFSCLEVKGDWVKVICNTDCEGCPSSGKVITGWIKWKINGKVILKQRYAC